jgi:hypothetical protein
VVEGPFEGAIWGSSKPTHRSAASGRVEVRKDGQRCVGLHPPDAPEAHPRNPWGLPGSRTCINKAGLALTTVGDKAPCPRPAEVVPDSCCGSIISNGEEEVEAWRCQLSRGDAAVEDKKENAESCQAP